ncbi:MAG3240 family lipoprotein [Mycoplasma phocoeninasale]|uniref:Lipoprotein n=1 Tax=Mycoplasma phocoeninasale TaxID=2726117 RepID=A0A858U5B9_9MOLU|nr:hypothetical protein [Mycoplasma phocoeninasale]MBN0970419.1 hypothetical protein [Mycoplasma phocoeninasale]QJG66455.1 hypothetical protein HGG64_01915 [Mycoplasma phocoeninasale]
MRNRKKFLIFLPLISLSFPLVAAACQKKGVQIDENIVTERYLKLLTLQQIATLNDIKPFIFHYKNGKKTYLSNPIIDQKSQSLIFRDGEEIKYRFNFELKKANEQVISQYDNIKIQSTDNPQNKIASLFNEYNFEDIKKYNGYSNGWFYYLANLKNINKDFYRIQDPVFFDFQTIIFRLVNDLQNNSGLVRVRDISNSMREPILLQKLYKNQYIQASSWLKADNQQFRDTFVNFLILYLNKFNLAIKSIDIDWSKSEIKESLDKRSNYITFKINNITTFDNQSLISNEIKTKTFYINGFRNYATNLKFGVGEQGLHEKYELFNDYVENPLLNISSLKFMRVVDNINNFIKGYGSLNYWNSRGLVYLFSKFKDKILSLDIPDVYKNVDAKYEIEDVQFTKYFKTDQIIRLIIKVTKKDGTEKRYVLLSQNFDDHGHYLRGIALKNVAVADLKPQDYHIFRENQNSKIKGIKLDDFIDSDINKPFTSLVQNALDRVYERWEGRNQVDASTIKKDDESMQVLMAYLNNFLLSYALENDDDEIHSGIKKIELQSVKSEESGKLTLNLAAYKFINNDDLNFSNLNEKPFYEFSIKINGFKDDSGANANSFTLIKKGAI